VFMLSRLQVSFSVKLLMVASWLCLLSGSSRPPTFTYSTLSASSSKWPLGLSSALTSRRSSPYWSHSSRQVARARLRYGSCSTNWAPAPRRRKSLLFCLDEPASVGSGESVSAGPWVCTRNVRCLVQVIRAVTILETHPMSSTPW
jgi:hypothetical protein